MAASSSTARVASRAAALERLEEFVPRAGARYAARRNEDLPGHPHVSGLSPYIRHRLLVESEVIAAVERRHKGEAAHKFLSEVWWRSYFKGWLERRPSIWSDYRRGLAEQLAVLDKDEALRRSWQQASDGQTGIECFDHWARELTSTGYLHNHARMWFASIWIFTLRLPWQLGADFFLRHLLDGDPASNTLSWRWVGGLHTPGKTYAATADNIAKNTGGRFRPSGLAAHCPALPMPTPHPKPLPVPQSDLIDPALPSALLLHDDDLAGDGFPQPLPPDTPLLFLTTTPSRSPLPVHPMVLDFVAEAIADTALRRGQPEAPRFTDSTLPSLVDHLAGLGVSQLVTPYAPVGPTAAALHELQQLLHPRGIRLARVLRSHDTNAWPYATGSYFTFQQKVMV